MALKVGRTPSDNFQSFWDDQVSEVPEEQQVWNKTGISSRYCRAKTTTPLAGITIEAEALNPCIPGPFAETPPPLPAAIGFTK
jgi:hypothetical protein